jgi:DNA-binding NarL/FixJ family response regulator
MESKIKVLLADDHQIMIDGMELFLNHESDIVVVGTALDGIEVMHKLKSLAVDILVLDLSMPRMDGQETLKAINAQYPDLKTVILSFYLDGDKIDAVMKAGAKGYVVKNRGGIDLTKAIRAVAAGSVYFPEDIMQTYTQYVALQSGRAQKVGIDGATLSPREIDVAACILDGMTSIQIGDVLCIEPTTVETHKKKIKHKFGLVNSAQIASLAQGLGIEKWSMRSKQK